MWIILFPFYNLYAVQSLDKNKLCPLNKCTNMTLFYRINLKGWLTVFFLGLIVFMGCSLTCVNASLKKKKTLFFTYLSFILHLSVPSHLNAPMSSCLYEAPPSEIRNGLRLVSWLSVLWLAKHQCASKRHAPHLSGMCSGCIVNYDIVNIAYQFEPDWDAENINEEDHAEPVQARLLMVCFCLLSHTFRYAVICKCYCFC